VTQPSDQPSAHYDRVTRAWGHLLGADLHYGWFDTGAEPLEQATAALTREMARAAQLEPGLAVLDVGCGTGSPACAIAEAHGVSVLGISTSPVGLAEARARASARGLSERARFEERDGMDNGLPAASFDRVWVMESSHLMPDKGALLREGARVLRPGGRLVLCDVIRRRELPRAEVMGNARAFDLLRRVYGRATMISLDDYAAAATAAGLTVAAATDISAETLATFARWRENGARHREAVVELVGEAYLAAFLDSCDVLEGFWEDGTLGYGLFVAEKAH
jgi:27-O-demethylrifamycin SV methyltransferase